MGAVYILAGPDLSQQTVDSLYFVLCRVEPGVFKIVLTLSRARVHFLLSPSLAVITENHKLYTWGCGAHGQLGQFSSEDTECPPDVLVPTQVKDHIHYV